ncbi:MAG: glycosyltransferase family 39 protein, partial [Oscillospiraceae bacterium]
YKLPGILCDMGLLIFFYKLAEKNMGKSVALWIGCIVAFIPIFVFNSAVWGQIESVLVLLLIASLYLLYKKKYMLSALLFVVSVLVKPQGLLVAPIYLFAFLETKDWKMIGKVMLASFALGFLLIIPFSPAWTTVDGNFFVKLLNSFNPLWLVEKYSATLGSYKFFTVNAFNFYGLLGFNWKPLDIQGMETLISILNWGIIALAIAISGFMYYKIKTPSGKIFMPAFMIIAFLFTFGFKMHERYMMPALAFLLCEYVFTRNKKLLWLCGGFSITTFLNAVYVLYTTVTLDNAMPLYSVVGVISMFEVALFILSVWVIIKDYMLPKKIEKKIAINKTNTESSEETQNSKKPKKALKKMVRADYLALAIITLAYSAIAFTNLGDTTAPQTFYKPLAENESFILELEEPANVSKITSYLGIGNVEGDAKLDMVASLDGNTWVQLESTATLESVFKWNVEDIVDFECKYIKCTPSMMDYTLFELAVWDEKGELVPIKSVVGNGESNYKNIVDEQKYAQDTSTYMNGSYFDEIYHPRTAYEHLHMMPYYETTHPPLGKLIMSIGVAIFGM